MLSIKSIASKETFPVRHPVLRAGKSLESCTFDGDDLSSTIHFGLYIDDALVGVISVFEVSNNIFIKKRQFQIRGMAVLESHQKKGCGEKLIRYVEENLRGEFIWFNAREIAVGFYKKLGYAPIGMPFEINDVGVHYVMYKNLEH